MAATRWMLHLKAQKVIFFGRSAEMKARRFISIRSRIIGYQDCNIALASNFNKAFSTGFVVN